jgi:hypothetical protein
MGRYALTIKLESLKAIKTRSANYDQLYAHMEVWAAAPATANSGPVVRWQHSANCHPHQNVASGSTVSLANMQEGWNDGEPWNQQLAFSGVVDEGDVIASAFFVVNQSSETHTERLKERFDKTVDAFSRGVEIGAVAGGAIAIIFPPVGGVVAGVAGALRGALEAVKKVFDWFHGEDSPPVNCDGEVLSGSWSKSVGELLPQPADGVHRFTMRLGSQSPSPAACGGRPDSELYFAVTAKLVPEFNEAFLPGNPRDQKTLRIVGGSNTPWHGQWGDAVDERSCRIIVHIDAPQDPRPTSGLGPSFRVGRFKVRLVEHQGAHNGPVILQVEREASKSVRLASTGTAGGRLVSRPQPCDTLDLGDGVLMHLFAVYNKYGVIIDYRIRYVRTSDSPIGVSSAWLVHSSRIN